MKNIFEIEKNPHAVALGRLGGLKGGPARAEKLSPEKRHEIALKAVQIRWENSSSPIPCFQCQNKELDFDEFEGNKIAVVCEKCGYVGPMANNKREAIREWNIINNPAQPLHISKGQEGGDKLLKL